MDEEITALEIELPSEGGDDATQGCAPGVAELLDGIDIVVVAVGLFAVGETLYLAAYYSRTPDQMERLSGSIWMSREDWKRSWKPWLRGTAFGFPFGSIPAAVV